MTKVSLNLPDEEIETIRKLAEKRKTTLTGVIRSAIASEKFLDDQLAEGNKLLLEKNNRLREVVFKS